MNDETDDLENIRPERFGWDADDLEGVEFEDDPDEDWPVDIDDTSFDHDLIEDEDDE